MSGRQTTDWMIRAHSTTRLIVVTVMCLVTHSSVQSSWWEKSRSSDQQAVTLPWQLSSSVVVKDHQGTSSGIKFLDDCCVKVMSLCQTPWQLSSSVIKEHQVVSCSLMIRWWSVCQRASLLDSVIKEHQQPWWSLMIAVWKSEFAWQCHQGNIKCYQVPWWFVCQGASLLDSVKRDTRCLIDRTDDLVKRALKNTCQATVLPSEFEECFSRSKEPSIVNSLCPFLCVFKHFRRRSIRPL